MKCLYILGIYWSTLLLATSCQALDAQNFPNFQYGSDPQQIMDVYLPAGRNLTTKIVLLIHGGGWSGGSKENMNAYVAYFQWLFPHLAIVNMNYRLGTVASPGLQKQLEDIGSVIQFMKSVSPTLNITGVFALVGISAGAHLSMLYGYGFDYARDVKLIGNFFGPTSFGDPAYRQNAYFNAGLAQPLVGNYTYDQNPTIYEIASPINYVKATAPKTISFYGNQDPLIPNSQGALLENKLDSVGVFNKYYLYDGVGHGNYTPVALQHMQLHFYYFVQNYFVNNFC